MIALEYPRSAIPSELTDLCNGRQWFPISQKERQPDIVFLLVKNHTTTIDFPREPKLNRIHPQQPDANLQEMQRTAG